MKVTHDNINTFLYTPGKYFVIPDFQRPYSWEKTNIVSFLEDIESVMIGNKKHYFGSIVYINEGNNSTIIDGQQRATTVLLMLTAIAHIVEDNPELTNISTDEIKDKYLYNKHDYSENSNRIKLRTVTTDNEIFAKIFDRLELSDSEANSKLYQAYDHFYEYFKAFTDLRKYVDILEKFEVVTIALDSSDDNPQKIFESINSTGKPLTDGDKIRNFALMLNNKDARKLVFEKYWSKIEKDLTDINKDFISDFFKYFLTSYLQKDIKIEQVYPEFKKLFAESIAENQEDVAELGEFYGNVLMYLQHYNFLKFNKDERQVYKCVANKAFRINFLKIETVYTFLMRVLDEFINGKISEQETVKVFDYVECFLARRVICNILTTGLNNLFSSLHKDIISHLNDFPSESYSNVLAYILTNKAGILRLPKQAEIESAIKTNPMYSQRNYYINFVLSSIDDKSKESTLLKQISNGSISLSIEHIMPQTLSPQWVADLGADYEAVYEQYIHTLANLTLTGYNSKYSNNSFAIKKSIENGFNESPLLINQFIKKYEKWDLKAFEERSQWWLSQIDSIWPVPESTYVPKQQLATELTFFDDTDIIGTKVSAVVIQGETIVCDSWASVLEVVVEKFFKIDEKLYDFIVADEFLSRYIKPNQDDLLSPRLIDGTSYYVGTGNNTNYKRIIVAKLAEYLELDKTDIKVILAN